MEVKNNIFNFLGSKENVLENFTYDLHVLKSILLGEDEAWWKMTLTPKDYRN